MRNKLFYRMLVAFLAAFIGVIGLLTFAAGGIIKHHYLNAVEESLSREGRELNRLVYNGYLDPDKRVVVREQILAVVRQFNGLVKIYFDDPAFGTVGFYDYVSGSKWAACAETDFFELTGAERGDDVEGYYYDLVNGYTSVRTLTYARAIAAVDDETGEEYPASNKTGIIVIHYDLSDIYATLKELYRDIFWTTVAAVLIITVTTVIITKTITKPITRMTDVVHSITRGSYDARMNLDRQDEIGELAKSFDEMADRVAGLEQTRREFVANVSHELRSPLTSMRGFLQAMEEGVIPADEHNKYIGVVLDETKRMSMIVNDLLDLARIESGQYSMVRSVFDLAELIGRTLLSFEERIKSAGIEVVTDVPDQILLVDADPERIGQVLHNLIDNAIKFMPETGGVLTVFVMADRRKATVGIKDNGMGIPKEDIPKIFDRFYKAEKAHTYYSGSGTGLGLAIVKSIIDRHNEDISVRSGVGFTEFVFTLKRVLNAKPQQIFEEQEAYYEKDQQ